MNELLSILANPLWASMAIILGFVLLIYGADWLVDGASTIAKRLGVSDLIIGLTVVAFGTSMPEFIVSTIAATQHNTEIAITNILGSNAINTFIILGLTAVIYPITSQKSSRTFDIPLSLLAGLLVLLFATYTQPIHFAWGELGSFSLHEGFISGIGGTILLLCFVLFMWHSIKFAKTNPDQPAEEVTTTDGTIWSALLLILAGLIALVVGGEAIVRSATSIAHMMGVSDAIIGLTIVALGTSLPELATSCVAAYKKNCDLALGNVIGSNIFNVFFILGTSALIHPLPVYPGLWLDAVMVVVSSLLVMIFVNSNPQHQILRRHGLILILVYAIYLTYRLLSVSTTPIETPTTDTIDTVVVVPQERHLVAYNGRYFRYSTRFADRNDQHLSAAQQIGLKNGLDNRESATKLKGQLREICTNQNYVVDDLTHSLPYLVPIAADRLDAIGAEFADILARNDLPHYRFRVTSILRSQEDIRRLQRHNHNAICNSPHNYGTTFDLAYCHYDQIVPTQDSMAEDNLKLVLAQVLLNQQRDGHIYVKYEHKQSCFHVTARN